MLGLFFSCGVQVTQEADSSPKIFFNGRDFTIDSNTNETIANQPNLFEYQWTFDFKESDGTLTDSCQTPFTLAANAITYESTVPASCLRFVMSGVGSEPIISPNSTVKMPLKLNYCLKIRNIKTAEVVVSGICGSSSGGNAGESVTCSGKYDSSDTKFDQCQWGP